ncbi:MAG: sodium ion-translocating decarboxylase subunit beta, partial [Alistipes sp.]|nr:sodium ion-translocating decarboxylase subunit beta [Alistipes sp.]
MILAVGVVGLSVQAWAQPEVAEVATAAVEAGAATAAVAQDVTPEDIDLSESLMNFVEQSGISGIINDWRVLVMLMISCLLLYLAIVKQFEPLLLLPIAFGMLLTNLPGAGMYHAELFAEGHVHWTNADGVGFDRIGGLIDFLYLGVKLGIYPCLIFVGVGAMTDFGPLIANPKSLLLGAAAQFGIFATFLGATAMGFTPAESGSIGIIGGA